MTTPPASPAPALSGIARHALIYSLAPLLQRFLALALVRVYTARLNSAQWGVSQMTDLLIVAAIQISGVNLLSAVVRFYFEHDDERDRKAVVSSAILFLLGVSLAVAGAALLAREPLTALLFETGDPKLAGDDLSLCLAVALATIPLALTSDAGFRYLQIQQRSQLISTLRVAKSVLEMALKVWFLVGLELGVIGFLLSILIGEALTTVLLTGWVLSRVGLRFSWHVLQPMLVYAAPLVPVGLCQMGLNQLDRLMLRQLAPQDEAMSWTGIYGLGYQLGWLVQTVVVGSFMQIWQPWIFGVRDPAERDRLLTRVSTWALQAIACCTIVLIAFGRELVHMLSGRPEFWEAWRVVPWVCAGYAFFALNGLSQVALLIAKRTGPMLHVNVVALAANVLLNLALVPRLGYVGAAVATLGTFALLGLLGTAVATRVVGARFELGRMAAALALVLATAGATFWIDARLSAGQAELLTAGTAAKAALAVAALALVWLGLLRAQERRALTDFVRRKLTRG